MAQVAFSVRMDGKLKEDFESLCETLGMNMTTAFNIFARAAVREQRIPFEVSAVKNCGSHYSIPKAQMACVAEPKTAYVTKTCSEQIDDPTEVLSTLYELADKLRLSSNGEQWTREEMNERCGH